MKTSLKIVGVHGLGDHRGEPWHETWEKAIRRSFPQPDVDLHFDWIDYDDIFDGVDLTVWQTAAAFSKLVGSALGEAFSAKKRGLFDQLDHTLRWYAGYVVAWVENPEFQAATRDRVLTKLEDAQPDLLLAHSLGSLVTYNALTHTDARANRAITAAVAQLNYVTLGSQIGNPFVVRNLTQGRIALPPIKKWLHLYNPEDAVFTSQIRMPGEPKFEQVDAAFDIEGIADHDPVQYLSRPATIDRVYRQVADEKRVADGGLTMRAFAATPPLVRQIEPRRRALLVGINDYPDPAARLDGCVNDVFLMSAVLQECRFAPDQIRICLNDRASAQGIRDRLSWLVADAHPHDELVFFYSGHGAQLATYGASDAVDHKDETLVPYDFDWTPERSVIDDQIFALYSQLPYDTRLVMIFDCCHSGGIHRSGSNKGRGLEPPDDIRHRAMRWNVAEQMWENRPLQPVTPKFSDDRVALRRYSGVNGDTRRLGRAMSLRGTTQTEYDDLAGQSKSPVGPYLPLIIEACQEGELASEYRHGNESYGAFTFSLAKTLRARQTLSFAELVKAATASLHKLGYDQTPQVLGPSQVLAAPVPWLGGVATVSSSKPRARTSAKKPPSPSV
ncbi:caspase family protein [uncultured Lamprocystis sp.]|jgi:hypothetical protein|uniref:caspase family protein n=1 Tax=uncultured Lamprocystis sp. TaxID=543132 RepID=UPI0025D5108F|nr:caspase family protein [uncultured Lamprocystis sp.]